MFDVRPVNEAGGLDLEKIKKVGSILKSSHKKSGAQKKYSEKILKEQSNLYDIKKYQEKTYEIEKILQQRILEQKKLERKIRQNRIELQQELEAARKGENKIMQMGVAFNSNEVPIIYRIEHLPKSASKVAEKNFSEKEEFILENDIWSEEDQKQEEEYLAKRSGFFQRNSLSELRLSLPALPKFKIPTLPEFPEAASDLNSKKSVFSFALAACFIFLIISGIGYVKKGLEIKQSVLGTSQVAYANLTQAKEDIMKNNFQDSAFRFNEAYDNFDNISKELDGLGTVFIDGSRFLPYISKLSSGKYLAEAGKNISRIGVLSGEIMKVLQQIQNPLENTANSSGSISFLKIFQDSNKNAQEILILLEDIEKDLNKVNVQDIPEDKRAQFVEIKNKLPQIKKFVKEFLDNGQIFSDILGGNGPRKYLFLFQNNQEMRATGGFIGSYGVLDIFNGRINKFFIDGIFNPDGQLREKIVPPAPIQKISAAWSLHDSNWFPDFPVSAEKAIWFYEKTGGPTVDGIITMTPDVMEKLLEVSGPIDMSEYNITITKDNFLEEVQREVEVDYDKELNQPKKILADLAPKILDAIFNSKKVSNVVKTLDILVESLSEKQILLYSRNYEIEKKISEENWSGEVLSADKDYLSVINSNINGFKTDGVIEEKIEHKAEIRDDGSIVDSVIITRKHNGGNEKYDWLNKVNANYMRVYVPKGSQLISAEGQTREFNSPPLDYKALNFKYDSQVEAEEKSITVDEKSGTRIYEDANKTVFANWVYVSPKEEVVVKYTYLLPFKIFINESNKPADTYSLLVQKQSGSSGSKLISNVIYPKGYGLIWKYPEALVDVPENFSDEGNNNLTIETSLKKDKFIGAVFSNKTKNFD